MKPALAVFWLLLTSLMASAVTTIDTTNRYSYGANLGWMNWCGNTNNGVTVGEYVCSGYLWAANVGWIHLGNNAPTNGIQYQNISPNDYGVNRDNQGNLSGYAWGANIGWIAFATNTATGPIPSADRPRVDVTSGKFGGMVYSANCGWISLSNAFGFVQTGAIVLADNDHDGISDSWELTYAPDLSRFSGTGDYDNDGFPDLAEYTGDTIPTNALSFLAITGCTTTNISGVTYDTITWSSRPTRQYIMQARQYLIPDFPFNDISVALNPDPGTNTTRTVTFGSPLEERYFRIQAVLP